MPSPPETLHPDGPVPGESLCAVRAAWLETLRELCLQAERQHEVIAAPTAGEALQAILTAKDGLYRRADELAMRALVLEASGVEPDTAAAALKPLLVAALRALADAEGRARNALSIRVAALRTQLDELRSGRAAQGAYAARRASATAPVPRFLDQTR